MVVGTKSDLLRKDNKILHLELRKKALEFSRVINGLKEDSCAPYFECSALTGFNVAHAFEYVFEMLDPDTTSSLGWG